MQANDMDQCLFLQKLPVELRLKIYELILRFEHPIKLRQVIPGSRDLSLLRTSRQVYNEALPVLYDSNTIIVTRNDFCKCTDPALKTPLKLDYARHLLILSFSSSIACTLRFLDERCDVCQPSAAGLIQMLTLMPRLQTVVIDYHKHIAEMRSFREMMIRDGKLELEPIPTGLGSYAYRLIGPAVGDLHIQFICRASWLGM